MIRILILAVVGAILQSSPSPAQEPEPNTRNGQPVSAPKPDAESPDVTAIRRAAQEFVSAFDKADAKAVAIHWTATGEYIDDTGRRFVGRDAIQQGYVEFFAANPGVKLQINIDSVRVLSSTLAIEDGSSALVTPGAGVVAMAQYTVVHEKVDGAWKMCSVRDAAIEIPLVLRNMTDLNWLIGTWVAEEHGNINESVCRWIANERFVERKYTVTHVDGTQDSGVQIIGWNPLGNHVQSWTFEPDGGYAVGIWLPTERGWSAEIQGTSGDGVPSASVTLLTGLDDNAYVWQSVERTLDGIALPDTDEVVLKRQPAGH